MIQRRSKSKRKTGKPKSNAQRSVSANANCAFKNHWLLQFGKAMLGIDPLSIECADDALLKKALRSVRRSGGGPGVDGVAIDVFVENEARNMRRIKNRLKGSEYRFKRLRRSVLPKPNGGERILGIPTVGDRVVLQAMRFVLEPYFEPLMCNGSHAYRASRGAQTAIAQVQNALQSKQHFVIETDVKKFFDSISHEILIQQVKSIVPTVASSELLRNSLRMSDHWFWKSTKGVAQGSPLSPTLANTFLLPFDRTVSRFDSSTLVRYADDLVVLCRTKELALQLVQQVDRSLQDLGLEMHPDKTRITNAASARFEFLGFSISASSIEPSQSNVEKLKKAIVRWTNRGKRCSPKHRIEHLAALVRSFACYYRQVNSGTAMVEIDELIAKRFKQLFKYPVRKFPKAVELHRKYKTMPLTGSSGKSRTSNSRFWNGYG